MRGFGYEFSRVSGTIRGPRDASAVFGGLLRVSGVGGDGAGLRGGAGLAGARTQSARPLPAAMLAGVWVSN